MAYNYGKPTRTTIKKSALYEGETIEKKMQRITNNKEPIKDSSPRIYTERHEGVKDEYNIRADKWERGTEVSTKLAEAHHKNREERHKKFQEKLKQENKGNETPGQSAQGGQEPVNQ